MQALSVQPFVKVQHAKRHTLIATALVVGAALLGLGTPRPVHAEMDVLSVLRNAVAGITQPAANTAQNTVKPTGGAYSASSVSNQCTNSVGQVVQVNAALQRQSVAHCYQAFSVLYNSQYQAPLASIEHVMPANIWQARSLPRKEVFHPNTDLLPGEVSPQLAQFKGSGYDRGHMTPSGDAWSEQSRYETFGLFNIVAQGSRLNREGWERVETTLRTFAVNNNTPIWIVTGPAFINSNTRLAQGRGPVIPSHVWKAVYLPSQNAAGVVWVANDDTQVFEYITLNELQRRTGVNVFPQLPAGLRSPNPQSLQRSFTGLFRGLKTIY